MAMRHTHVLAPFAIICLLGGGARAEDWYTGSGQGASSAERPHASLDLAFTGTTQDTFHGTFIGTIAPFAPMDDSGLRLRLGGVLGSYSYISSVKGVGRVQGKQEDGSFLAGYEWVTHNASVDIYVGPEVANNTLSVVDPGNKVTGATIGAKAAIDFYVNPTSYSLVSGNMSFSTANNAYYARFKAGLAVASGVFVGPEALFLGDNQYSQIRFGLHITGAKLGPLQFGLSGGYVSDRIRGKGAYAILDTRVVF